MSELTTEKEPDSRGKVSGVPLITGTRLPAQAILDNFDADLSDVEIAEASMSRSRRFGR